MFDKWRGWEIKLTIALLLAIVLVGLSACTTMPDGSVPKKIVEWAETNAYLVKTEWGSGSGFWLNDTQFLTNCHVVDGRNESITVEPTSREWVLPMTLKVCDKDSDIALLVYTQGDLPFIPMPTIIADTRPDVGQILYGVGYPLGASLHITEGHYQGYDSSGRYIISTPTILGDSGSAAIYIDWRGRVVVVGIRTGIRVIPSGYSGLFYVTHMVSIKDSHEINKFLRENA